MGHLLCRILFRYWGYINIHLSCVLKATNVNDLPPPSNFLADVLGHDLGNSSNQEYLVLLIRYRIPIIYTLMGLVFIDGIFS